jgi:hypothetical protein
MKRTKINYGKKAAPINGDEEDFLQGKRVLAVFYNSPIPARKTKRRMNKRLRRSQRAIEKTEKNNLNHN